MSSRLKTGVREVLESINPLKRLKKKKVNLLTAPPESVDSEALAVGGDVVMLFRRATDAGVTLDGQLVARRDAINNLLFDKKYGEARSLLAGFREDIEASVSLKKDAALHVDPPGITPGEQEHARRLRLSIDEDIDKRRFDEAADEIDQLAEVVALAQMRSDLGLDRVAAILRDEINAELPDGTLPKEKDEVEKLQAVALKAMEGDLSAEKIENARALAKPVHDAIDAIERRQEVAAADPATLYQRLKMRLDDVTKYPDEHRSLAIRRATQAVGAADADVQLKMSLYNRAAVGEARDKAAKPVAAAIGVLREKLDKLTPQLRAHDEEVRKFFSTLKKMRAEIGIADTLPETDGGTDTLWKAERQAYGVSRASVITLQDEHKFREANVELAKCAVLMKALLDKRREKIDTDIGTATTAGVAQARTLVDTLKNGNLLKVLTPEQQLKLLRALPPGPANKAARIKVMADSSMDPEFVKAETVVLKSVVKTLQGDDGKNATPESKEAKRQWQEAETNWEQWSKTDPDKIRAVFERTVLMQFKEMCKLAGFAKPEDYPPGFPDPPVTVRLDDLAPSDFGETTPVFPAEIILNKSHRMFGDFKEMMDTVLHENAHAWQNMIVAQFKGTAPFRPEDKAKVNGPTAPASMKLQAELFAENDGSYFNSADSREAYRHEPLEEQAWGFGGKSSQALLVPPPQRSFDSSKGLKNKFWAVASLTRKVDAVVRLRERHGIYVDEWEGEKAADKKLTLEGVPGLSSSQRLTIKSVVNEFTLMLDLNASALRGRVVQKSEVEQEMTELAKTSHPGKKLGELTALERKAVFDQVLLAADWEASGSEDDQTAVVRAKDEVDVEHARLVLDETVANLT